MAAPLLCDLQSSAARVSVQLTFARDTHLEPTTRSFAVYPPARAHFVYACAFGDCDGTHDLGEEVFGLLKAGKTQASGVRHCVGQRPCGVGHDPSCGLGLTYVVSVLYRAPQPETPWQPAATA